METHIKNPYQRAIVTLAGLEGGSLLVTLTTLGLSFFGLTNLALTWISLFFFVILGLMWVIIWFLGARQVRHAKDFLASDRPLIRWTYSIAEWQQLKEFSGRRKRAIGKSSGAA